MLFRQADLDGIEAGTITLAFRRWDTPRVRVGSRLRTRIGVIEIDEVTPIADEDVTDTDAVRAGAASGAAVVEGLPRRAGSPLWRLRLHLAGPDPRVALRSRADLSAADVDELDRKLQRLDRASSHGAWTIGTLALIHRRPATRAADLAESVGRPTQPFKIDVRKLKELGLTESLEVGYRLSDRGTAYLRLREDPD